MSLSVSFSSIDIPQKYISMEIGRPGIDANKSLILISSSDDKLSFLEKKRALKRYTTERERLVYRFIQFSIQG